MFYKSRPWCNASSKACSNASSNARFYTALPAIIVAPRKKGKSSGYGY
jgi:hypothetical protein